MNTVRTCSVDELDEKLSGDGVTLLDVREYPEYAEAHAEGARLVPLGSLKQNPRLAVESGEVALLCRSGTRAREAARLLSAQSLLEPVVVEGGMEAWKRAGYPTKRQKGPMALERQVRIAAGTLVLTGLLVPGLQFLPYVAGAGLVFAGLTDTCAMGLLLARLPWNRQRAETAAACSVGQ